MITQRQLKQIPDDLVITGIAHTGEVRINGMALSPEKSLKVHNHSPDGFAWGYSGSGPAQLALAICLRYLDETLAEIIHQDFKFKVVAKWPSNKDFQVRINLEKEIKEILIENDIEIT